MENYENPTETIPSMETLCAADFVTVPIKYDDTFEGDGRLADAVEREPFIGIPLTPDREPLMFRFARDLVHDPLDPAPSTLARDAKITPAMYRAAAAPRVVRAVPFGNEYAYYTEARFRGLKLRPEDGWTEALKFRREYYHFPDVPLTVLHESAGERTLCLDQRPEEARGEDDHTGPDDVRVAVTVAVDRRREDDHNRKDPKRAIVKLHLMDRAYKHENGMTVRCSVAYRSQYPESVTAPFAFTDLFGVADVVLKFFEYTVNVPYDGVFYKIILSFRKNKRRPGDSFRPAQKIKGFLNGIGNDDNDIVNNYTLRVKCRDVIEFDKFARIATVLIDFCSYQHSMFGRIDEFAGYGPKWKEFRRSVHDGVRASIDCMYPHNACFCQDEEEDTEVPDNMFEEFTLYLGLKCMANLDRRLRLNLIHLAREEFRFEHYRAE